MSRGVPCGRTDTDMAMLTVAFSNLAKAPKSIHNETGTTHKRKPGTRLYEDQKT
jgi:hypothetical protein